MCFFRTGDLDNGQLTIMCQTSIGIVGTPVRGCPLVPGCCGHPGRGVPTGWDENRYGIRAGERSSPLRGVTARIYIYLNV